MLSMQREILTTGQCLFGGTDEYHAVGALQQGGKTTITSRSMQATPA